MKTNEKSLEVEPKMLKSGDRVAMLAGTETFEGRAASEFQGRELAISSSQPKFYKKRNDYLYEVFFRNDYRLVRKIQVFGNDLASL